MSELQYVNSELRVIKSEVRIARKKKPELRDMNSQLREKKSDCEKIVRITRKKSQLPFYIYSVAEAGFGSFTQDSSMC